MGNNDSKPQGSHGSSYGATIDSIQNIMAIDKAMVQKLRSHMMTQLQAGLEKEGQTINMIPTYVGTVPTGKEKGEFLAVDVGGSNFRVVKASLSGDVSGIKMSEVKEPISEVCVAVLTKARDVEHLLSHVSFSGNQDRNW